MKIGIIILNYNSSDLSIQLLKKIQKFEILNLNVSCIIVDNNSSEKEKTKLVLYSDYVLFNDNNFGYAKGNNIGFKFINKNNDLDYILFANPDVVFEEDYLIKCIDFLEQHNDYGICSSVRTNSIDSNYQQTQFWTLPDLKQCIKDCFIIGRKRLAKKNIELFSSLDTDQTVQVVPGSLFVIRKTTFVDVGMFDEQTFLYFEENCMAQKLKNINKKEMILASTTYEHNHIKKSKGNKKMYFYYSKSRDYYVKRYLFNNHYKIGYFVYKFFSIFSRIERNIVEIFNR